MRTTTKTEQSVVDLASTAAAADALRPKPSMIEAFAGRFRSYLRRRKAKREARQTPLSPALYDFSSLLSLYEESTTDNAFCPTGKGGGVDPTCTSGGKPGPKTKLRTQHRLRQILAGKGKGKPKPPTPKKTTKPSPEPTPPAPTPAPTPAPKPAAVTVDYDQKDPHHEEARKIRDDHGGGR